MKSIEHNKNIWEEKVKQQSRWRVLQVKHSIPYSELDYLTEEEIAKNGIPLEFGHTLEQQLQGQIDAGFVIAGFYEDTFGGEKLLDRYTSSFIATRAVKPKE
ncbi:MULTISPECIES: hypothetical protein [unclassified Paenibacillus]|uniref:hypothetical protein n=1 Tax=unclassified Paenibacillus TaxID=185978 RepID=UPI0011B00643|nr:MULTISPECIES: hypothetical protein [unclassified Paenibacillus]MBJ9990777.1 hypothetical protein [Paenibacillus sp. S28]